MQDNEIHALLIEDIKERNKKGYETYGKPMLPHDGRNTLQDAYEEALDLAIYLKKKLIEDNQ